jgi:hypothetical protein
MSITKKLIRPTRIINSNGLNSKPEYKYKKGVDSSKVRGLTRSSVSFPASSLVKSSWSMLLMAKCSL